jgi:hypothetical protein
MFKPENKIIIVDDIQEHLDELSKPFRDIGIDCTSFIYDATYNPPLSNVRIAFFDIILNPSGGGSDPQRQNELAMAIKQYIAKDNGPYILIFWTSNKDKIEDIKDYIQRVHPDCPKPFFVDFIDKDVFMHKPIKLIHKLEKIINNETLKILFEFEHTAAKAASKTISQLYDIIPGKDTWGVTKDFQKNFEKVFSKIAVQSLGYKHAKEDPDNGIISSLLPILSYQIEKSQKLGKWKNYLVTLEKARSQKDIRYPKDFCEDKLNSILHIHQQDKIDKSDRGSVVIIKSDASFKTNYGLPFADWYALLLPGVTQPNRDISKVVAIEISASCDYSQKKPRLNKYILAVLLPVGAEKEIKKDRLPQYLMLIDGIFSTDSKFKICINLNFVFSALPTDPKLGEPLFVLKKEIMDQIGNRYANHVSRIGITSF